MMYDYYKNKNNLLSHSNTILNDNFFKLVGGVDKNLKKRNLFFKKFNITAEKGLEKFYKKKIDILIVSGNTNMHHKILKDALKIKKLKVVLCEKPFTNSSKSAADIINLYKNKKIKLFINYNRIADSVSSRIKKTLQKNKNYYFAEVFFSKELLVNGCHFINLFQFYFGKIKNSISLKKKREFILFFENACVSFSQENYKKTNFYVIKSKNIEINSKSINNKIILKKNKKIFKLSEYNEYINSNTFKQIKNYFNKKKFSLCNSLDALETLKVIEKIK
jgi:predicted dehydrogenase